MSHMNWKVGLQFVGASFCVLPSGQWGRLRHAADEPGLGELCHTAALCPAGEQDPAALAATRRAHWSGRGRGGCESFISA